MKELFSEQLKLKKISGPTLPDSHKKVIFTNLLQQLQEISFEVNKFKNLDSI